MLRLELNLYLQEFDVEEVKNQLPFILKIEILFS